MDCHPALVALSKRQSQLFAELSEAEGKAKAAEMRVAELRARLDELMSLERLIEKSFLDGPEEMLDNDTVLKVSAMIKSALDRAPTNGLTVQQISEAIGVRRPTVSATLYNMKKRGEVEHNEQSGSYRLFRTPAPGPMRSAILSTPR
jgi:hypothetical protein